MAQYCEDCGCRVYNGHCVNCHEDVYIAEQHYELGTYGDCSADFKNKLSEQESYPVKMMRHQYSEEDGDGNIIWIDYNPDYFTPSTDTREV